MPVSSGWATFLRTTGELVLMAGFAFVICTAVIVPAVIFIQSAREAAPVPRTDTQAQRAAAEDFFDGMHPHGMQVPNP
jgi:hypothetical protein